MKDNNKTNSGKFGPSGNFSRPFEFDQVSVNYFEPVFAVWSWFVYMYLCVYAFMWFMCWRANGSNDLDCGELCLV